MARIYPGETLTVRANLEDVYGEAVDPASVTFEYKRGRNGSRNSGTVTEISTGLFESSFTPDRGGTWFWRWKSTTPALVQEGFYRVERGFEDDEVTSDYGDY